MQTKRTAKLLVELEKSNDFAELEANNVGEVCKANDDVFMLNFTFN